MITYEQPPLRLAEDPRNTVGVIEAGDFQLNNPVIDTPGMCTSRVSTMLSTLTNRLGLLSLLRHRQYHVRLEICVYTPSEFGQ